MDSENISLSISIASDLHLEHYVSASEIPKFNEIIEPNPDNILLLLGDIGNPFQHSYSDFVKWCSKNFKKVLVIAGNHEYYGSNIKDTNKQIEKVCEKYNAVFLNNSVYKYKDYIIAGTTLWSYIPEDKYSLIKSCINDYNRIENFTPKDSVDLFHENISFIEKVIKDNKECKIIIATHHTPLLLNTSAPCYDNSSHNCAFSSDLGEYVEKVSMWFMVILIIIIKEIKLFIKILLCIVIKWDIQEVSPKIIIKIYPSNLNNLEIYYFIII